MSGPHYGSCAVCGRRTPRLRTARIAFRLLLGAKAVFPAGTQVCGWHEGELLAADHPYWDLADQPIERPILESWIAEFERWVAGDCPVQYTPGEWEWMRSRVQWFREAVAKSPDSDLASLRNSILDDVLRSRGISIAGGAREVFSSSPV